MAKNMAVIENGVVSTINWCSDREQPTESLVDIGDKPVGIGDTYSDGHFYRDGEEVLSELEKARQQIEDIQAELYDAKNALIISGVIQEE